MMTNMTKDDPRYPYTYACDHIRSQTGYRLSRAEASRILQAIADAIGIEERKLAEKLAHVHLNRSEQDIEQEVAKLLQTQGLI